MGANQARKRKPAGPQSNRTVKTTVVLDVATHARLAAAAALRGMDRSAFAAEAIKTALVGYVVIDRRSKPADEVDPSGDIESAA